MKMGGGAELIGLIYRNTTFFMCVFPTLTTDLRFPLAQTEKVYFFSWLNFLQNFLIKFMKDERGKTMRF